MRAGVGGRAHEPAKRKTGKDRASYEGRRIVPAKSPYRIEKLRRGRPADGF
jgi:hypothetical protein